MRTQRSPRIRERRESFRLRRLSAVAAITVLTAVGIGPAPTPFSAATASSAIEDEVVVPERAGVVCGPGAAFGGHSLRCVRGAGFRPVAGSAYGLLPVSAPRWTDGRTPRTRGTSVAV